MPTLPQPLERVRDYYSGKLAEHGPSARGVDWNSVESQHTRFAELTKALRGDTTGSVVDVGCGYGALLDHLEALGWNGMYLGYDISPAMVETAREHHPDRRFSTSRPDAKSFDYALASGIFNVKLDTDVALWEQLVVDTIELLNGVATTAFAFNMLTSYSDADRMRGDLYYAEPSRYFDLCVRRFSRHVALFHDYGLYEFTLVVSK